MYVCTVGKYFGLPHDTEIRGITIVPITVQLSTLKQLDIHTQCTYNMI